MLIVLLKNKQSASRIYLQFKNFNIFPLPQIKNLPTLKNTKLFIVCGIVALIETPMSQKRFTKWKNINKNTYLFTLQLNQLNIIGILLKLIPLSTK